MLSASGLGGGVGGVGPGGVGPGGVGPGGVGGTGGLYPGLLPGGIITCEK